MFGMSPLGGFGSPFGMSPMGNPMGQIAPLAMGLEMGLQMGEMMQQGGGGLEGGPQNGMMQELMAVIMLLMMELEGGGMGGGMPGMGGGMPGWGGVPGFGGGFPGYGGGGFPGGGGYGAPYGGGGGYGAPYGGGGGYGGPGGGSAGGGAPYPILPTGNASQAAQIAESQLGKGAINVNLPGYTHAGGVTNDCADFVSSCVADAGLFHKTAGDANVRQFQSDLAHQGWHPVNRAQAQPGDVAIILGGGVQHTELVTAPGARQAVGANGTSYERVSTDNLNWASGVTYWAPPPH
ncbi:MAG: hypothetical protein ACYCW6_06115 [Candidatus Xenobia bacterium]